MLRLTTCDRWYRIRSIVQSLKQTGSARFQREQVGIGNRLEIPSTTVEPISEAVREQDIAAIGQLLRIIDRLLECALRANAEPLRFHHEATIFREPWK
jgi:hypothetical protein